MGWMVSVLGFFAFRYCVYVGLLSKPSWTAPHGCLEAQEVLPFDPDVFSLDNVSSECYICLEAFGPEKEIRRTKCGHCFHSECLGNWFEMSRHCPVCRSDLSHRGEHFVTVTSAAPPERWSDAPIVVGRPTTEDEEAPAASAAAEV